MTLFLINTDDVIFNNTDDDDNEVDAISNNADNKYNQIIPSLKTRLAKAILLKDSSLQKATRVIQSNHQIPTFTSKLNEHDIQGWEQVERPKRRKSDKTSKSAKTSTMIKLAETEITEHVKETSFKKLLEEKKTDKLMETGNTQSRRANLSICFKNYSTKTTYNPTCKICISFPLFLPPLIRYNLVQAYSN